MASAARASSPSIPALSASHPRLYSKLALEEPELSPREVAVAFTDAEKTFVSEASVYRILKAEGLVTSPVFIVMKAADAFANPTTAINQFWQTDFTYLKVTGWMRFNQVSFSVRSPPRLT